MNESFLHIVELAPPIALGMALIVLGWVLKKSPIHDWLIPLIVLFVGGITYPLIADLSKITYPVYNQNVLNGVYGFGIGGMAIGAHQALKQFRGRPRKSSGDTTFFKKKKKNRK